MYANKFRPVFLGLFFAVFAFAAAVAAQAQITDLHFIGQAKYQIGSTTTPLADIHVDLIGNNDVILGSAVTDSGGNFEILIPLVTNCTPTPTYRVNLTSPTWSFQGSGATVGCLPAGFHSFNNLIMMRVLSVVFEDNYEDQTSVNPNAGGGLRIYPDKQSPTDNTIDRKKINIRVYTTASQAVVVLYYKVFDLDDPSANTAPLDSNGSAGNDNRATNSNPAVNLLQSIQINPFASGLIEFKTTMQPGDNFAVVASTKSDYLNGIIVDGTNLKDANGNVINTDDGSPEAALRTQMLTVWRRLHIEVDSLGSATGNKVTGTFPANKKISAGNKTLDVTVSPALEVNRFENGRLVIGNRSLSVIAATATEDANTASTVTIFNNMGSFNISAGDPFTLYDDDDFNDNDGVSLDGDDTEDIPEPDTSMLRSNDVACSSSATGAVTQDCNAFVTAYVTPKYDLSGSNENIAFMLNHNISTHPTNDPVPTSEIRSFFDFDNVATEASADFWTVYILGAYQYDKRADSDPYVEGGVGGVTDSLGGTGQGAILYNETGRGVEYVTGYQSRPVSRAHTMTHEVGHIFDGRHDDGGLMAPSLIRTIGTFSDTTLNKIRGGTGILHP